jgi:hypothetical protein
MSDCKYCDKDFSSKKEKLEHELDEHQDEMSSHAKSDKKSELNKLEQQTQTSKHNRKKKLQFAGIGVLLVGLVAGGGFWASQNIDFGGAQTTNASAGIGTPVHWHADYRITVCSEEKVLRGGPTKAHTHGEKTFHLEGVRTNREQATLNWIVDALGGQLEEDAIMGRTSCNGKPANLTVKANGNTLEDPLNYVVRDGDFIRIKYG